MSETYLGAFGLEAAPFSKEIADADLWLPTSKAGVVDELCEAVSEHASVLLTGDPGVGKTCVSINLCPCKHGTAVRAGPFLRVRHQGHPAQRPQGFRLPDSSLMAVGSMAECAVILDNADSVSILVAASLRVIASCSQPPPHTR